MSIIVMKGMAMANSPKIVTAMTLRRNVTPGHTDKRQLACTRMQLRFILLWSRELFPTHPHVPHVFGRTKTS